MRRHMGVDDRAKEAPTMRYHRGGGFIARRFDSQEAADLFTSRGYSERDVIERVRLCASAGADRAAAAGRQVDFADAGGRPRAGDTWGLGRSPLHRFPVLSASRRLSG